MMVYRGRLCMSSACTRRCRGSTHPARWSAPRARRFQIDAAGLAIHAAVARLRLADLLGGSEGDALRASALSSAAREQLTALSAVTDTLAPGFSNG
jgi:L-alanine-DL-glutamate epimerase-like enolase superfamily enzyme